VGLKDKATVEEALQELKTIKADVRIMPDVLNI
jgi:hypothetical protein